jgi:hypothetical protein
MLLGKKSLFMDKTENVVPNNSSIVACIFVAMEICLPCRFLAVDVSSGSTVPAFRRHVTIWMFQNVEACTVYFYNFFTNCEL